MIFLKRKLCSKAKCNKDTWAQRRQPRGDLVNKAEHDDQKDVTNYNQKIQMDS